MAGDDLRPPDLVTAIWARSLSKPISMSWSRSEVAIAIINELETGGRRGKRRLYI